MSLLGMEVILPGALLACGCWLGYVLVRRSRSHRRDRADEGPAASPREMRLPLRGIPEEGIGVGDAVKRVTDAFRIKPCNGCDRRRQVLNRWVIKSSERSSRGQRP